MQAGLELENKVKRAEESNLLWIERTLFMWIERETTNLPASPRQHQQTASSSSLVRMEPRAAPASESATEQPLPPPPAPPLTPKLAMQARLELENIAKRAEESNLIYSIVNAFLNRITFQHPQVEELLEAALRDETCLAPSIQLRVEEVFAPIFFYYPNGLKDRSVWEARDTSQYIRQWYEFASMRERLPPDAAATEHGNELSKAQVKQIFKWYMEDMKKNLRAEQQGKSYTYYKSCAEAKMKREAGHVFVANAIWAIGLPRLPACATEQRHEAQLSAQDLGAYQEAIHSVLEWLDRIANALLNHRTTKEYQDALRKSGVAHGRSGLSATEQETRAVTRKAKYDMRIATTLAQQWDNGALTWNDCDRWQRKLLEAYWNGSLHERLREVASQGSADTMCRTPSLAIGSATHLYQVNAASGPESSQPRR